MKNMKRTAVVFLLAVVPLCSIPAQPTPDGPEAADTLLPEGETEQQEEPSEPPETLSQLEDWRDTLRFGINDAVIELLPTLTRDRRDELAPEVLDLFGTSNNSEVLRAAVVYLRELSIDEGDERAKQLVREYFDRPSELVTEVLRYLRETEANLDEETRDILTEISRMPPPGRAVAAVRLYAEADTTIEELIELYREPGMPEDVRGRILVEMGIRGDPRAFDFVSDVLGDDEEAVTSLQRFAIDTLGKLGDERAIPMILRQLDSDSSMTRAYAVSALENFDTPETNQALLASLRDGFWRVRVAALQAVGERKMEDALPAVLYMVRRDPERQVRLEAIRAVGALDHPDGWDAVLRRMADPRVNAAERTEMISVSLRSNPERAVPTITDLVQEEWDTRNSVILDAIGRVVSQLEHDAIAPVIEQLLNHPNYIIQLYGIRGAGRNRLSRYRETLEELRESDAHRMIRDSATEALERM